MHASSGPSIFGLNIQDYSYISLVEHIYNPHLLDGLLLFNPEPGRL
jgi:hypothetical protein